MDRHIRRSGVVESALMMMVVIRQCYTMHSAVQVLFYYSFKSGTRAGQCPESPGLNVRITGLDFRARSLQGCRMADGRGKILTRSLMHGPAATGSASPAPRLAPGSRPLFCRRNHNRSCSDSRLANGNWCKSSVVRCGGNALTPALFPSVFGTAASRLSVKRLPSIGTAKRPLWHRSETGGPDLQPGALPLEKVAERIKAIGYKDSVGEVFRRPRH